MRLVIAIDFGTSHSGYAFAWNTGSEDPQTWRDWPHAPTRYDKTLSDLLLDEGGEVLAWGYSVRAVLGDLRMKKLSANKKRFRGYKMKLREKSDSSRGPLFKHDDGHTYYAVDLIAKYLQKLKSFTLENVHKSGVSELRENEIRWVVTVPAIWGDLEKRWMKEAASRAGFPTESDRFILVLEPEAAALYCQKHSDLSSEAGGLGKGTKFMILDAGGGTVDLTTHEVLEIGQLREIVQGSGAPCGSVEIDKRFVDYLERRLQPDMVRKFEKDDPSAWIELMDTWERTKCDPDVQERKRRIGIPGKLVRILDRNAPNVLERLSEEQGGEDSEIQVEHKHFLEIFNPVLDEVESAVKHQFEILDKRNERCDYLFIVGGFAASKLLYERIKARFGGRVRKVIVPTEPGKSVLWGAVYFGLNPAKAITERALRTTYGYDISRPQEPNDPPALLFKHAENGKMYCDKVFSIFAKEGEVIKVDEKRERSILPLYNTQTEVTLNLFKSSNPHALTTDDKAVTFLGTVVINSPIGAKQRREDRPIDLRFYFGLTEIKVEATDRNTGTPVRTTLKYPD